MKIRAAIHADAPAWLAMRNDLWPDHESRWHAVEIERYFGGELRMPVEVLMAFDDDGTPLGFAELNIRAYADGCESENVAYLEGWYVISSARRKGVGRALIQAAEEWARSRGCTEFASDALLDNQTSERAHLALRFTEVGQVRQFMKHL